jgi:hypothetical protein
MEGAQTMPGKYENCRYLFIEAIKKNPANIDYAIFKERF